MMNLTSYGHVMESVIQSKGSRKKSRIVPFLVKYRVPNFNFFLQLFYGISVYINKGEENEGFDPV
jgi:hypothetical protein